MPAVYWLLLMAVGCAGAVIGDVACARRNRVWPFHEDPPRRTWREFTAGRWQ